MFWVQLNQLGWAFFECLKAWLLQSIRQGTRSTLAFFERASLPSACSKWVSNRPASIGAVVREILGGRHGMRHCCVRSNSVSFISTLEDACLLVWDICLLAHG